MDALAGRLEAIYDGRPILLVGWSLGGMFARQLACRHPEMVRAVVTLGSPFSGNLKTNTNVREFYERVAGHDVDKPPFERIMAKPPVPTLAIWSRADGIVAPAAAKGLAEESDKAVEFKCNHMAFGVSRTTARQVVDEIKLFLASKPRDAKDSTSPKTAR
jgi:pimeloyl-ACP methyl ester carboxylesterase